MTFFILHVFWEVTRKIIHHLMDGVEPEHIEVARTAARGVPGIQEAIVRGRWMGRSLTLEIEAELPKHTTLEDAEEMRKTVEARVRQAVDEVRHVRWIPRRSGSGRQEEDRRVYIRG